MFARLGIVCACLGKPRLSVQTRKWYTICWALPRSVLQVLSTWLYGLEKKPKKEKWS